MAKAKSSKKKNSKKGVTRKPQAKSRANSPTVAVKVLQLLEFRVVATLLIAVAFAWGIIQLASMPLNDGESGPGSTAGNSSSNMDRNNGQSATGQDYDGASYDDFTFYAKLRDFEVKARQDNPYAAPTRNWDTHYLIQAGAFREFDSADEQLASLILLDLDARIERDGGWHRLLIGPLTSRSAMSAARERLIDSGIDAEVMRRRVPRN